MSNRQQDDISACACARMARAMDTEMAEQELAGRQAQCHRMRRPSNSRIEKHRIIQESSREKLEKGLGPAG